MKRKPTVWIWFLFVLWTLPSGVNAASEASDPYQAGLRALRAGKTQQAIEYLSQAINAQPNEHKYHNDRGVAYKRSGNLEMALADYTKSLQLKPDYTNALNNRGVLYLEQGEYDKAVRDFTEALKHGGIESKVLTNLGIARAKMGDHRIAVTDLEKAVSSRPVDTRAYFHLGESLEQLGQGDRALKMYKVAVGLTSDHVFKDEIEKRIFQLEKGLPLSKPFHAAVERNRVDTGIRRPSQQQSTVPKVQTPPKESPALRNIVRASPPPDASITLRKNRSPEPVISAPTLDALEEHCRTKALGKLSSNAVEIYRQGVQFVGKDDLNKALIRFEDTRQLEKRTKNAYGVAWSSFETAKIHSRLGDKTRATAYFQEALQSFIKLKASDEIIVTLVELAANQKAAGQRDKAAAYFARAVEEAGLAGNSSLVKDIEALAAGKKPSPEKRQASVEQPGQTEQAKPASRSDVPPPKPVITVPDQRATVAGPEIKPSRGTAEQPRKLAATPVSPGEKEKPQPGPALTEKLDNVGRGPTLGKDSGTLIKPARPVTSVSDRVNDESRKTVKTDAAPQPERVVLWAKGTQPSKRIASADKSTGVEPSAPGKYSGVVKTPGPVARPPVTERRASNDRNAAERYIRQDLAELKKFKTVNDEPGMVAVLERLADRYSQIGQYEKAMYGLRASLAFREKLGLQTGKKQILYHSGLIQQRLGNSSEALEELTRAMYLEPESKDQALNKALDSAARDAAKRQGLPVEDILQSFAGLWKNRVNGNGYGETQMLYLIAGIYEKAEKPAEALKYYERAAASILTDKSRMYEKMGKTELAEQALAQALEAFRKLDYSRYINIIRKSKANNTLSRSYRDLR